VVTGSPVEVILAAAADARLVVMGKRGLGVFARVIVGSTSIAVAGRAKAPVVIVPEDWTREDHRDGPVVLGIDP
jgi:nucleotide-binding universal stress UspA family protein